MMTKLQERQNVIYYHEEIISFKDNSDNAVVTHCIIVSYDI